MSKQINSFSKNILKSLTPIFKTLIILAFLETFTTNIVLASNMKKWSEKTNYPYDAVQFVKENPIEGNMFNLYGWGGFLIWQLPEYKTFIDGRMPSWESNGNSPLEDYIEIKENKNYELFESYVDKYNITWVLLPKKNKLGNYLAKQEPWDIYYDDPHSIIYAKR
jgi:hypothetical protein